MCYYHSSVFGKNPLLWLWCVSFLFIKKKKKFTKKCFTHINFSMNNIWYSWCSFDFDYGTAVVRMCLRNLFLRGESQLLHFEIYCSVCAEATSSIGCSPPKTECLRDTRLTWSETCHWLWLKDSLLALLNLPWTVRQYRSFSHKLLSLSFTQCQTSMAVCWRSQSFLAYFHECSVFSCDCFLENPD